MSDWSDDEDTEDKYIMKVGKQEKKVFGEEIPFDLIIEETALIDPVYMGTDHKRSFYSGNVKATHPTKQYVNLKTPLALIQEPNKDTVTFHFHLKLPIPKIPSHTYNSVDKAVVSYVWYECLEHGCDESELIKVLWLKSIADATTKHLGYSLPFDKLTCIKGLEKDDYIEFVDLIADLVVIIANSPLFKHKETDKPFICCAYAACIHKTDSSKPCQFSKPALLRKATTNKSLPVDVSDEHNEIFTSTELLRINIVFHRVLHERNGVLRIRHVFDICKELNIPYDKHQLPKHMVLNCTEFLVKSQEECRDLIDQIRIKDKVVFDPTADLFKFVIPKWLKEEFKGSEILLYEHHFMLIDVDGGGSIDAEELQQLLLGFGTKVALDEAQAILDEYDIDGGGTIDFVEFMILIYRIQRGTVDMETSELAQALMEAKSQLPIFEEILEVRENPPELCGVIHFGNTPVTATFSVLGPADSIYSGAKLVLQLIFYDGYPYRQPDVKILNRIFHINIISQLDGGGRFLHIKELWSSDWSICKLLAHFIEILRQPDIELLPPNLKEIYDEWYDKLYNDLLIKVPEYRRDKEDGKFKADAKVNSTSEHKQSYKDDKNNENLPNSGRITNFDDKAQHKVSPREKSSSVKADGNKTDCKDAIELSAVIPGRYLPNLTIESVTNADTKKKIDTLSRVEQMHLTVLFAYLTDYRKYKLAVSDYIAKYNNEDEDSKPHD